MTTKIAAAASAKAHLSKINEIHAKKKEIVTEVGGRKQKEGVLHKVSKREGEEGVGAVLFRSRGVPYMG